MQMQLLAPSLTYPVFLGKSFNNLSLSFLFHKIGVISALTVEKDLRRSNEKRYVKVLYKYVKSQTNVRY